MVRRGTMRTIFGRSRRLVLTSVGLLCCSAWFTLAAGQGPLRAAPSTCRCTTPTTERIPTRGTTGPGDLRAACCPGDLRAAFGTSGTGRLRGSRDASRACSASTTASILGVSRRRLSDQSVRSWRHSRRGSAAGTRCGIKAAGRGLRRTGNLPAGHPGRAGRSRTTLRICTARCWQRPYRPCPG